MNALSGPELVALIAAFLGLVVFACGVAVGRLWGYAPREARRAPRRPASAPAQSDKRRTS